MPSHDHYAWAAAPEPWVACALDQCAGYRALMQLVRGKPSGVTSRTAVGKVAPCAQCLGADDVERPQWFWEGSLLVFCDVKNELL